MRGRFMPVRDRNPMVPEGLALTVEAGLVAQPALRIQSAAELAERLMPFIGSGKVPRFGVGQTRSIIPIPLVRRDTPRISAPEIVIPAPPPLPSFDEEFIQDAGPQIIRHSPSNRIGAMWAMAVGFAIGLGASYFSGLF
jgi:hypothetical protein